MITSNVVTYTVIIDAPNPEKKLMPGMTATSTIFVAEASNDLLIPMQAAKFDPDPQMLMAYRESLGVKHDSASTERRWNGQRRRMMNDSTMAHKQNSEDFERIWVKKGSRIYPVRVKIDINDGVNYGIVSGLNEGDSVILTMSSANGSVKKSQYSGARSPFMPTPPRRRR